MEQQPRANVRITTKSIAELEKIRMSGLRRWRCSELVAVEVEHVFPNEAYSDHRTCTTNPCIKSHIFRLGASNACLEPRLQ